MIGSCSVIQNQIDQIFELMTVVAVQQGVSLEMNGGKMLHFVIVGVVAAVAPPPLFSAFTFRPAARCGLNCLISSRRAYTVQHGPKLGYDIKIADCTMKNTN